MLRHFQRIVTISAQFQSSKPEIDLDKLQSARVQQTSLTLSLKCQYVLGGGSSESLIMHVRLIVDPCQVRERDLRRLKHEKA
jgi:hypothetical protein